MVVAVYIWCNHRPFPLNQFSNLSNTDVNGALRPVLGR